MSRNSTIFQLQTQGKSLAEISDHVQLTRERVRQILKDKYFCNSHGRAFKDACPLCDVEREYKIVLHTADEKKLSQEIERLAGSGRTGELNVQRTLLVKFLKDKYNYSFSQLGKVMRRHYSSVMNLYYK